jgi:hypothetical protein
MGSSSTKKIPIVTQKNIISSNKVNNIYDKILEKEKSVPIDGINLIPRSKFLVSKKLVQSPLSITDHSAGYLTVLPVPFSKCSSLNFPISSNSRCISLSSTKILITSLLSSTILDLGSLKIEYIPNMNQPREHHSMLKINDRVLVTGGENQGVINTCEMLSDCWEYTSSLNVPRSWHSSVVANGVPYVFGGIKTNTIERLKGKWELLTVNLSWNINRIGLAPLGDRILLVGGEVIGQGYSFGAWEFDIKTLNLLNVKKPPLQGLFYSQGGFFEDHAVLLTAGIILLYNIQYKTWSIMNSN